MSTITDPRVPGGVYATKGRQYRLVYVWPTGDLSVIWAGADTAAMVECWTWGEWDVIVSLPLSATDMEAIDKLKAALEQLDKVPDTGERVAGKLDLVFNAIDAGLIATDQGAPGPTVTDSEAGAGHPQAWDGTDGEPLTGPEAERLEAGLAAVRGQRDPYQETATDVGAMTGNQLVGAVLDGLFQVSADADKEADTDQEAPATVYTGQVGTGKTIHELKPGAFEIGDEVTSRCGRTGLLSKPRATVTCKRCQKG